MHTKDVVRQAVGGVFRVRGIGTNSPHEDTGHIELWVRRGADCNNIARADSIWVEPEYVELVPD